MPDAGGITGAEGGPDGHEQSVAPVGWVGHETRPIIRCWLRCQLHTRAAAIRMSRPITASRAAPIELSTRLRLGISDAAGLDLIPRSIDLHHPLSGLTLDVRCLALVAAGVVDPAEATPGGPRVRDAERDKPKISYGSLKITGLSPPGLSGRSPTTAWASVVTGSPGGTRRRHEAFRPPVAEINQAMIWNWPDVEAWAKATGRLTAHGEAAAGLSLRGSGTPRPHTRPSRPSAPSASRSRRSCQR